MPAWAEPTGALGAVPETEWFGHNPYAEWYANTIRIPDTPAAQHHHEVFSDAPYDDFLDQWTASKFDPAAWARLFAEAGASYVIPTTKHHDGVALWDAPGTGSRNTVHRGPRRDLVGEIADAVRAGRPEVRGVLLRRPGLGRDRLSPAHQPRRLHGLATEGSRLQRCTRACMSAISSPGTQPDVLWNDINWPDAGKRTGSPGRCTSSSPTTTPAIPTA